MNKADTEHAIVIMQAYVDGKEIEWRWHGITTWKSISGGEYGGRSWDFDSYEYRVKKEPRIIYVNEYYPDRNIAGYYYPSEWLADANARLGATRVAVKYQEVIE